MQRWDTAVSVRGLIRELAALSAGEGSLDESQVAVHVLVVCYSQPAVTLARARISRKGPRNGTRRSSVRYASWEMSMSLLQHFLQRLSLSSG